MRARSLSMSLHPHSCVKLRAVGDGNQDLAAIDLGHQGIGRAVAWVRPELLVGSVFFSVCARAHAWAGCKGSTEDS